MARFADLSAITQSKFLSFVLRHEPEAIGLALESGGWVAVTDLLGALDAHDKSLTREQLERLIRESDKQRFALSPDGTMIRANQGHSQDVDLGYEMVVPPETLFHGTVERVLAAILAQGLLKGRRHHVHLSATRELAVVVAQRRGAALVLEVAAAEMARQGYEFFRSPNGVWLTEHVPARFLREEPPTAPG